MTQDLSNERCLVMRSRLREGYRLSEFGMKDLQHVLTDWFPRAVYANLTPDTVCVDIEVRRGYISGKNVLDVDFKRADGSVIKRESYPQDRIIGATCPYYDPKKAKYDGKEDGYDRRLAYYSTT